MRSLHLLIFKTIFPFVERIYICSRRIYSLIYFDYKLIKRYDLALNISKKERKGERERFSLRRYFVISISQKQLIERKEERN